MEMRLFGCVYHTKSMVFQLNFADATSHSPDVSLWQGSLPCILGSKFLGFLYHC